jgi:protein involved in ribonucleotide reduction
MSVSELAQRYSILLAFDSLTGNFRDFPQFLEENVRIPVQRRGSSVSIVSGYGLDDRAIEVRTPAEAKVFFL